MDDNKFALVLIIILVIVSGNITNCGIRQQADKVIHELKQPCTE